MRQLSFLLLVLSIIPGCGIGGFWMEGNPYITPSTPELLLWKKPAATPEQRRQASADCGGQASDSNPTPYSEDRVEKHKLPGDTHIFQAYSRMHHEWQQCMLDSGYIYTGRCYDNVKTNVAPMCKGHKLWPVSEYRPD